MLLLVSAAVCFAEDSIRDARRRSVLGDAGFASGVNSPKPQVYQSRLSEMTKAGYVIRETNDDGNETCFRMRTIGIEWLSGLLLEKKNKRY